MKKNLIWQMQLSKIVYNIPFMSKLIILSGAAHAQCSGDVNTCREAFRHDLDGSNSLLLQLIVYVQNV